MNILVAFISFKMVELLVLEIKSLFGTKLVEKCKQNWKFMKDLLHGWGSCLMGEL